MRLIYSVMALVGVLVVSGCAHHGGAHRGGHEFVAKNYGLTYEQVREAAQDGDADAQYALGYMYYYGQNVTRNGKQARFWIAKAAAQNHQQAIRALRMMGAQPHYAARDNAWTETSQTAPMRDSSESNRWQEVRRPQASAEPEQFSPKGFNKENQASQFQREQTSVADAKPAQMDNVQSQVKKGVAAQEKASSKHEKAKTAAQLRKKHTQAALHKKDRAKQFASKKQAGEKAIYENTASDNTASEDTVSEKSASHSKTSASLTKDERSILSVPAQHYTLQLMGSGSKAAIQKVIESNHLQQKAKVYHTNLKGKDYYVLIYGSYPTRAAANAAIGALPSNLKQLKPWAKPYTSVKASIKTATSEQARNRNS